MTDRENKTGRKYRSIAYDNAGNLPASRRALDSETGILKALDSLFSDPRFLNCVTKLRIYPAHEGVYSEWPVFVSEELVRALKKMGIEKPYEHQTRAINEVFQGHNIVVYTPTASGKTLCYNVPVVNALLKNPETRALYLFPTKALSQDQVAELSQLSNCLPKPLKVFTYDGDTPHDERQAIRRMGQIIVTNPDMLHQGIMPHHTKWIKLFENLKYVIIDEMHVYRGVFGSHVANVIRRLKRIAAFYRSKPLFILASATIANPKELAMKLIEEDVVEIAGDTAPRGEKRFIIYNPPVVEPVYGLRASALSEAGKIALEFLKHRVRTIIFVGSRLSVEVLTTYLKETLERNKAMEGRVRGYRGGYLPEKRREIEKGLRDGTVEGVVSTNALELGIDIGGLDVSILCGYPGTVASTWQQAGRSGRRKGLSVAILVARSSPVDQYLATNPDYLLDSSPEHALLNPDNLIILCSHVKCAAFELPFVEGEKFGTANITEILEFLEEEEIIHKKGGRWHWMTDSYPADGVSLRSVEAENFVVVDNTNKNRIIAQVDFASAARTIHKGAIYMVEGEKYKVVELDWNERRAYVEEADDDYYTDAISYTKVTVLDVFGEKSVPRSVVEWGEVKVLEHVSGFKKIKFYTSENVGFGEVTLPDNEKHTTACWFTPDRDIFPELKVSRTQYIDGLLGIANVIHDLATILLMCDSHDIARTIGDKSATWFLKQQREAGRALVETVEHSSMSIDLLDSFDPTVFIYESMPGGIGFAEKLFSEHLVLLERARKLIMSCSCREGCPSCVGPSDELSRDTRTVALRILDMLLQSS